MVDYNGLENRRAERHRGFESLSLRSIKLKPADFQRVFCFFVLEVSFEVPLFLLYSFLSSLATIDDGQPAVQRGEVHTVIAHGIAYLFSLRCVINEIE